MANRPTDEQVRARVRTIAGKTISAVDAVARAFRRTITEIADSTERKLIALLADPASALQSAREIQNLLYLQEEIRKQLIDAGYYRLAERFVVMFDDTRALTLQAVEAVGVDTGRIAPFNEAALHGLRSLTLQEMAHLGDQAVFEIARAVILSTLHGGDRARAIERIRAALDANLKNHASTYFDTSLSAYDRELHWQAYRASGIDRMTYVGPDDLKTRRFCAMRVDKTFTLREIDEMDNGTRLLPVSRYGGGWNCRHIWMPAPPGDEPYTPPPPKASRGPKPVVVPSAMITPADLASAGQALDRARRDLLARSSRLRYWRRKNDAGRIRRAEEQLVAARAEVEFAKRNVASVQKALAEVPGLTQKLMNDWDDGPSAEALERHRGTRSAKEYRAAVERHVRKLIRKADLFLNVQTHALEGILESRRLKTQFETGTSSGAFGWSREQFEKKFFGFTSSTPVERRPVYGFLSDDYRRITSGPFDSAKHYGPVAFRFKRDVKLRSTFTEGDSLDSNFGTVVAVLPSPLNNPSFRSLQYVVDPLQAKSIRDINRDYVEAQMFGGLTFDDIVEVIFSDRGDFDRFAAKFKAAGLAVRLAEK